MRTRFLLLCLWTIVLAVGCDDDATGPNGDLRLGLVIGDIEGSDIGSTCSPVTLAGANSIFVINSLGTDDSLRVAALVDTSGTDTGLSFVFDAGGSYIGNVICDLGGDDLQADGVTENGPVLHKRWHLEGLEPMGSYVMSFTGGAAGSGTRSLRIFVDVDGNGTIEPDEVEDLIGLNGVVETRVFGATIRANANGVIRGEYWGGSTNGAGHNGAWRGWTIEGEE